MNFNFKRGIVMSKIDIKNFYKTAVAQKEFNSDFWNEVREISTEGELKAFIEEKVQPAAKKMGYNFSTKDLLNYEKQMAIRTTEQQLDAVSGGVSAKNWALGGMFSLMALGAGIVGTTNSASAELTTQDVAKSTKVMESEIVKNVEVPKTSPIQNKEESEEAKEAEETSQASVDENVHKKDITAVDAEQSTADGSDLKPEQVTSNISDLETAKAATDVDPKEVFETRQLLTDDQQLYAYEALNLQEAYALLKSGVVENVRFYGNIMEIETVNSIRRYTSDKGDAFTELLYMLYPSPAGDLNTNTGFTGRDSFAMYGGMSPELVAKLFAILNDCRNKKIEIPEEFENITLKKEFVRNNLSYVNPKLKNALAWLKAKGLLTAEGFEKVKAIEDAINSAEKLKSNVDSTDIKKLSDKSKYINVALKYEGNIVTYFDGEIKKLEKRNDHETIEIIKELTQLNKEGLKNESENIDKKQKSYNVDFIELNKQAKSIENSPISKKTKFLMYFINTMKKAAELEVTDGSSYPKYFTEHILMSYMCQTLNGSEDVQKLYREIAEQLSQNETNKTQTPEEEKETIVTKIDAQKKEIDSLSDIINKFGIQELSPYKSETQSNGTTFKIGTIGEDGNVQIQDDTFADCADIAARHVINLLTFANEQNWNSILKGANVRELNAKLKEVVDAIGSKSQVKFYDLKTRLQMFFLYQMGFIEGIDNEEDIEYRSKNGADDVTPLARTLWEYVICNMNTENLEKGPDKDKGFYSIAYPYDKNHELETGYINMLKLMWNMASALNLKSDALGLAKSKISALSELEEYNETVFEEALSSIFSLFYTGGEIEFTLSDCEYENNEITGDITVDITKDDQNLNFTICHDSGHGETTYNPVNFNVYKYLEKYCQDDESKLVVLEKLKKDLNLNSKEEDLLEKIIKGLNETLSDFEKLLLNSFIDGSCIWGKFMPPIGFYGAFSEEELKPDDAFRNTDLYKKYKALSAREALQGEENNLNRIYEVIDIDTMRGAEKIIVIQDGKRQEPRNFSDILYEKYLKQYEEFFRSKPFTNINDCMLFHEFGEFMNFDIIKTSEEGKVELFIKNIPENGELIIPSTVYDKAGKKYKVTQFDKYSDVAFETLKTLKFTGDFENLNFSSPIFNDANLRSVEINGNIINLTINEIAFQGCNFLNTFVVQGKVENLNIDKDTFQGCNVLSTFVVQGNVENLNIDKDAFRDCVFFLKIFLPKSLENRIPRDFIKKDKIIFYDTTDNGVLHLKVNDLTHYITLDDKKTLETLGGDFQIVQAKDSEGNDVNITLFFGDFEDEFLKVKDKVGLRYLRKLPITKL